MRILMAWTKAKAQASQKNQKGIVIIEYLILAGAIVAGGLSLGSYFGALNTAFDNLASNI